jgi:hypothetical protein
MIEPLIPAAPVTRYSIRGEPAVSSSGEMA